MGTPTPPPSIPGVLCTNCDGVLWPAGVTPRFVKISFRFMVKCPDCPNAAPNIDFWFEQEPENPCFWRYTDSLFYGSLNVKPVGSDLFLTSPEVPAEWIYFYDEADPCETNFTNEFLECIEFVGSKGGTAHVHWPGP